MITENLHDLDILSFIKNNPDKLIILGFGGADYITSKGYYKFGLVYNMHIKIISGNSIGTSSNRSILEGVLASVKKINKPSNVVVLTATVLGFKKAIKNKGPNKDICQEIIKIVEINKKSNLYCYSTINSVEQIRYLLDNPSKYFKVV